jgi:ABC-2 type transport system permease protein
VPLLLVSPLFGVDPSPANPVAGGLFVVSLGLAIVVGLAVECLFGIFTVAMDQPVWLVNYVRVALATLLSGSLLPLAYYPWNLGEVFAWLPPASMAWAPLAIYTAADDPTILLFRQLLWAVVLWPLAAWQWRRHREKLSSYGG